MQERTRIRPIPAQFEGRCCIQYTDPLTGRVLEEIKGKNHVFETQLSGLAELNTTALKADLLLTTGGYLPTDSDIPFIPGQPIGYGRVDTSGEGLYRGAYRAADSYYNKKTLSKITNKYVYDFLQTQALGGPVNWVGLTAHMGQGAGTSALQVPNLYNTYSSYPRIMDCESGELISILSYSSGSNIYSIRACIDNPLISSARRDVDLSRFVGTYYAIYAACIAINLESSDFYVSIYARKTSSVNKYDWYVFQFDSDFSELKASWTIPSSSVTGNNYFGGAGVVRDGKIHFFKTVNSSNNKYLDYADLILDLNALTAVSTASKFWDGQVSYNIIFINSSLLLKYKSSAWYSIAVNYNDNGVFATHFNANCFLKTGLFFGSEGIMLCIPPCIASRDQDYSFILRSRIPSLNGQWGLRYYTNTSVSVPFAYTRYQVPSDAPVRPEGSGMTVTYELDISI